MRLLMLAGILFLAGCGNLWMPPPTPEQRAIMEKEDAERAAQDAQEKAVRAKERADEIIAEYRPFCTQLGFVEGTPDFGNCVLSLYQNDETLKAQDKNSRRAAAAAILHSSGLLAPKPVYVAPLNVAPSNTTTTTNCYKSGNMVNCTTQ